MVCVQNTNDGVLKVHYEYVKNHKNVNSGCTMPPKLLTFVPEKSHVREALLFCFNLKKIGRRKSSIIREGLWRQHLIVNAVPSLV